jgi:hypothetical protein
MRPGCKANTHDYGPQIKEQMCRLCFRPRCPYLCENSVRGGTQCRMLKEDCTAHRTGGELAFEARKLP